MTSVSAIKKQLRVQLRAKSRELLPDAVIRESRRCCESLFGTDVYKASAALSVYLSMGSGEVQTGDIISDALAQRKRVFVPKVTGVGSQDMVMVEIFSLDEVNSFPKSKWGIPEPQLTSDFIDNTKNGVIDLVICPGTGFDRAGNRLGHGKGYYDTFISTLISSNAALSLSPPCTVGLALNFQLLEENVIPMETHDRPLDFVITSDFTYCCKN